MKTYSVALRFEDKLKSGRYCRACLKLFNDTNRRIMYCCIFTISIHDNFFACEKCFYKILKDLEDELL